jgi:hypothetical protein
MNAISPLDVVMDVVLFAVAVLGLMRFVPPVGAKATLGRAAGRFAHVASDELEDAVESEGKRTYFSWAGIITIIVCGITWHAVLFCSLAIEHSLRSEGVPSWLAVMVAVLPGALPPLLYRWATQFLLLRRLDRKFGHA